MSLLTILFWAWCAISLVWLIGRRVHAARANKAAESATTEQTEAAETPTLIADDAGDAPLPTTPPIPAPQPIAEAAPIPEVPQFDQPLPGAAPAPPPLPASVAPPMTTEPEFVAPAPAVAQEPAPVAPVAPAPVPVSPHAEPIGVPPVAATMRGLSEIMAGMQMPCDLAPLMGEAGATSIGLRRATFATTTHRPHEVGGALANELERLGMAIQSVSENQAVATRGADSVMLTIHRTAEMFPTAPEMAVVVEMDVV